MQLTTDVIQYIEKAIRVAKIVGIDTLLIEPTAIRGVDDARSVVLLETENLPTIPTELAISRLSQFQARLDVVKSQGKFTCDTVLKTVKSASMPEYSFVYMLNLKSERTKIDFRCMDGARLKSVIPRKVNDSGGVKVQITDNVVSTLQKGMAATGADSVKLLGSSTGASFELMDVTGDVFNHTFIDDPQTPFSFKCNVKTLLALLKEEPNQEITISTKTLKVKVNGITVYVIVSA